MLSSHLMVSEHYYHCGLINVCNNNIDRPAYLLNLKFWVNKSIYNMLSLSFRWLQCVHRNIIDDGTYDNMSWAAYHASLLPSRDLSPAILHLLPLFPDESKSAAIRHSSFDGCHSAFCARSSSRTSVCYHLWSTPLRHRQRDSMDMTSKSRRRLLCPYLKRTTYWNYRPTDIADWLEASGWIEAIVPAKVASTGTAQSFLKA